MDKLLWKVSLNGRLRKDNRLIITGVVAQLVERLICIQEAWGSTPHNSTFLLYYININILTSLSNHSTNPSCWFFLFLFFFFFGTYCFISLSTFRPWWSFRTFLFSWAFSAISSFSSFGYNLKPNTLGTNSSFLK